MTKSRRASLDAVISKKSASAPDACELRQARLRLALAWICLAGILWIFWLDYGTRFEAAQRARVHGR